jgi:hypothetical protein
MIRSNILPWPQAPHMWPAPAPLPSLHLPFTPQLIWGERRLPPELPGHVQLLHLIPGGHALSQLTQRHGLPLCSHATLPCVTPLLPWRPDGRLGLHLGHRT